MDEKKDWSEVDFGELLEQSLRQLREGDLVEGTVVKVTDKEVYVDVGAKSEGIVPRSEFKEEVKPGDKVTVYIESVDGRGTNRHGPGALPGQRRPSGGGLRGERLSAGLPGGHPAGAELRPLGG